MESKRKINPWIMHIKKEASKRGISYSSAISLPEVKESYKQSKEKSSAKKIKQSQQVQRKRSEQEVEVITPPSKRQERK